MRGSRAIQRPALVVAMVTSAVALAGPALAHETRSAPGSLEMVVGFGTEPAYENEPNAVSVALTRGGEPVASGVNLEVEIVHGEESTSLVVEPAFLVGASGEPGTYEASFIPTRPGQYVFHVTGRVQGTRVDEEFVSGPDTFSDIEARSEVSFPAADPSAGELAERIDREAERLRAAAGEARDEAASARTMALVALIVGGLGLLTGITIGGTALRRTRS